MLQPVVNCFQIVSLRYWWHLSSVFWKKYISCELLSDCIFEVLVTPLLRRWCLSPLLWIAFRLYLWGIGDTGGMVDGEPVPVVNCFQIVSLRYWWHQKILTSTYLPSCELLSDCIFEVLVTPCRPRHSYHRSLWIAFRLYLWGIGDTLRSIGPPTPLVVNCFQIVSLRYWWHR